MATSTPTRTRRSPSSVTTKRSRALPGLECMPKPGGPMETHSVLVTPELAQAFLDHPPARFADGHEVRHRKRLKGHVETIMGWIERGEWVESPEGFALAPDGGVLEGMQRCEAIVRTKTACPVRITFNVPPELFPTLNTGKNRTAKDTLESDGVATNALTLGSAVKLLHIYDLWREDPHLYANWNAWAKIRMTNTQVLQARRAHPGLEQLTTPGRRMQLARINDAAATVFLYLAQSAWPASVQTKFVRSGEGEDQYFRTGPLIDFVEQVVDGEMIGKGDPAYSLRFWADRGPGRDWDARGRRQAHLAALLLAWQAAARNEQLDAIRLVKPRSGELVPMPLPYSPV